MANKTITLLTDCDARLVPQGVPISLHKGTQVKVVQALGGNVTVNVNGNLAQIAASNAHALGDNFLPSTPEVSPDAPLEEHVWAWLRTCYDPEIPVNIVDLGLVYDCRISQLVDGRTRVDVRMTLTAPGCGMGGVIAEEVRQKLESLPTVDTASVEIVYDPPWDRSMMSEAARLELGMF